MPLILGTNSIKDTGYDVANSLRFNQGDSPYLDRSPSSSGNRRTFTTSVWIKRSGSFTSNNIGIWSALVGDDNATLQFNSSSQIHFYEYLGGYTARLQTNAIYRDPSAWLHVVLAVDTTQSTSTNRLKLYVNGEQITSFSGTTYPSQNLELSWNKNINQKIGQHAGGAGGNYMNGYMAEFVNIDGQQLTPASFGEFDSDSPTIWKPKDVSGLTFGTNGFYLDFEDSSALGNDAAGSNNFTVNNLTAIDQSTDTCTNNAITFNPLDVTADDEPTLSEGNLKAVADGAFHQQRSTFYLTSGKWFWEFKPTTVGDACQGGVVGSNYAGGSGLRRNYSYNGQKYTDGSSASYGASYTANDIIGVALDLDNGTLIFYKNGASQGTAYTDMLSAIGQDGWTPDVIIYNSTVEMNFGSPPYSISSGNSDGNGYGNFEYAVPSGYYALNTKNLAEFG